MSCLNFLGLDLRRDVEDAERGLDREPLLPHYDDDTSLQRQVHRELDIYKSFRALTQGYMPSTDQLIINLRIVLAAGLLDPNRDDVSDSGRALVHYTKQCIGQLIELLRDKNGNDQIQDLVWSLSKARLVPDVDRIVERASRIKPTSQVAYQTLKIVISLLFTNANVRLLTSDLLTLGREVFKDVAFTLSEVSKDAGQRVNPTEEERGLARDASEETRDLPSRQHLQEEVADIAEVVRDGVAEVATSAGESVLDKLQGGERQVLLHRLKQAISQARQRPQFTESVSFLSKLLQNQLQSYVNVVNQAAQAAEEGIDIDPEVDHAAKCLLSFLKTFGDAEAWQDLEAKFRRLLQHGRDNSQFNELMVQFGTALHDMLLDPEFFDHAEERFHGLQERWRDMATEVSFRDELDAFFATLRQTALSVYSDEQVLKLADTCAMISKIIWPDNQFSSELLTDANVFIPQLVKLVTCIPIPRVEIANPQVDLLLENIIFEPGRTVNDSSFLPYKLRFETYNDIEIRKARYRTTSAVRTLVRIKLHGISVRVEEMGFWMRSRVGLWRLLDEGIVSFRLDERGMDVELDVEVGKEALEKVLSLEGVRVRLHKLDWTLKKSKASLLAWLLKPLLKPVLRRTIENMVASAIADGLHAANRELVYMRERLRATRISNPDSLVTFFKAVAARLSAPDDPDSYVRVGVFQPGHGVFDGVYAPGSIVKLWQEEGLKAPQRIREQEKDGWRNDIFSAHTVRA